MLQYGVVNKYDPIDITTAITAGMNLLSGLAFRPHLHCQRKPRTATKLVTERSGSSVNPLGWGGGRTYITRMYAETHTWHTCMHAYGYMQVAMIAMTAPAGMNLSPGARGDLRLAAGPRRPDACRQRRPAAGSPSYASPTRVVQGVCERAAPPEKAAGGKTSLQKMESGQEGSFRRRIKGQRLAQKGVSFHRQRYEAREMLRL